MNSSSKTLVEPRTTRRPRCFATAALPRSVEVSPLLASSAAAAISAAAAAAAAVGDGAAMRPPSQKAQTGRCSGYEIGPLDIVATAGRFTLRVDPYG